MLDLEEYFKNFFKGSRNTSLQAIKYFMNKYNNIEKEMKFIHIAGTNGKGSCVEIISNILVKQGYKVGKFLSPHLVRYNERISINGKEISDKEMTNLIMEIQPLINQYNENAEVSVSLFEVMLIMAMIYFYRNNVDFVVLETGLGGLNDATNIITNPLVSIITSIGYDHTQILGDTLEKIAYQKAGIIKKNSSTVIFEQCPEIDNIFESTCLQKNNKLHTVRNIDISNYSFDDDLQYFDYKNIKHLELNLKGKFQIRNACICIEAIKILNNLGYVVSEESIKEGLKTVVHKARMEKLNDRPLIIFDGAHNVAAIEELKSMINMYYRNCMKVYVISILKRKDYKNMLKLLSKDSNATFILTSGNDPKKFTDAHELYGCMKEYTQAEKISIKSLEEAIENAVRGEIPTFFVGSFYTYGTVSKGIEKSTII